MKDKVTMEQVEFKCPNCGGTKFGREVLSYEEYFLGVNGWILDRDEIQSQMSSFCCRECFIPVDMDESDKQRKVVLE